MSMTYPQQPSQPYAYPPPPIPPRRPKWFTTTMLVLGFLAAFVIGVAAGAGANSGSTSARETVTVRVPAPGSDAPPAETAQAGAPSAKPAGPATTMSDGVYQVGVDVQAGQYKTAGPPEDAIVDICYWARNKDDSGEFESLITNGTVGGPGSVTVNDGEFVKLSGDCTWSKVG